MKKLFLLSLIAATGCGGSLTDEQRKKLHDGMDQQQLVRMSDSEIITASLDQGRAVFSALEKVQFDSSKVDSISAQYGVRLRWITPGSPNALEIEKQLIEAYVIGLETGSTQDNIQKLRQTPQSEEYDSVLYSRPLVSPMADGVLNVEGVWNIYLAKKDIIVNASKKK